MTFGSITIGFPWALLLLLLVPVAVYFGWRRMAFSGRTRRIMVLTVRVAIFVLLILSLADTRWLAPGGPKSTVFLIDASASTANFQVAASGFVRQALQVMGPLDRGGVVAFGRSPLVLQPVGSSKDFLAASIPADDRSDLGAALRLGAAMLPPDGVRRLVVLSDGWDTAGDAEGVIDSLAAAGIVVDIVMPTTPSQGVAARNIDTPVVVSDGEPFDAYLNYEAAQNADATLQVTIDGTPRPPQNVQLFAGASALAMPVTAVGEGYHRITAALTVAGGPTTSTSGYFVAKAKPAVLIYEDRTGEGAPLAGTLEAAGLRVETRASRTIPTTVAPLRDFDAIAFANVAATSLTLDQQKTIDSYVRQLGKGLMIVGGPNSFTLGDYGGTLMGDLLPVNADVPPKPEEGAFGLGLVIDKSGSMDLRADGVTKMQMVKESALQAVELLRDDDYITIVVFDSVHRYLVNPQRVGDNRGVPAIQARIAAIQADGGTEIFPALERGFEGIQQTAARYKHIVLLSDGQAPGGDYDRLLNDLRTAKITLSTIAVGADSDTALMSRLAKEGGGRYYFTERVRDIPRIMSRETSIAIGATTAQGKVTPQLVSPSPVLRGLIPAEIPDLATYAVTTPKDAAETILVSPSGDPILAHWQVGSGRAVAFTSGFLPEWSGDWQNWSRLTQFWGQAIRYAIGPPVDSGLSVTTDVDADRAVITVDAINDDGSFIDLATMDATIVSPSGRTSTGQIRQVAPGKYEATVLAGEGGAYELRVRMTKNGIPERNDVSGFVAVTDPETRTLVPNVRLMRLLSGSTGGHQISAPEAAWAEGPRPPGITRQVLWPWFTGAALVLFVLDIAMRRLRGWSFLRRR